MRLEATYAEVRHVLQIRREEFDWLENCEHVGYMRRPIRGNLDTVHEEIGSHEVYRVDLHAYTCITNLSFTAHIARVQCCLNDE